MTHETSALILGFAIVKGLLIALVASALDLAFWKGIVLALTSGAIGAIGAIVAAVIAARAADRNRVEIEHIKHKLGADRRSSDPRDSDRPTGDNGESDDG